MAAFPCSSSPSDNDHHSVHHQQQPYFFLISDSSSIAPKITSINFMSSGPFQQQTHSLNPITISPNSTHSPHSTHPSSLELEAMEKIETESVTVKKNESISKSKNKKVQAKHAKQKMMEKKRVSSEVEAASTDYVHVRARRGQATVSHSLAERARREKISQRMKFLQSLVPGCDKINGKALVLDEIINYIQSLQNQVESLAAKLASAYPFSGDLLEMKFDTNELTTERYSTSLDPIMPSSILSDSFQLGSIADKMTARSSNSFSFQNDEGSTVPIAKDEQNLIVWDVEDQKMEMASLYGLDCFGSIIT